MPSQRPLKVPFGNPSRRAFKIDNVGQVADVDDRQWKWRKAEGKGDGKPKPPSGQGHQGNRQHWSAGGMRRKQADAWDQSWRSDSSQRELEHLRNMVVTLQRRCLRSGIPASVIPGLVQAKNA